MEKEHPTLEVKIEELEEAVEVGQAVELTEFAAFQACQAALEQARQEKARQELNAALQSGDIDQLKKAIDTDRIAMVAFTQLLNTSSFTSIISGFRMNQRMLAGCY